MAKLTHKLAAMSSDKGKTIEEIIVAAIKEAGSIAGAARLLGLNPNTVRYHKRRLGLKVEVSYTATVERAL